MRYFLLALTVCACSKSTDKSATVDVNEVQLVEDAAVAADAPAAVSPADAPSAVTP